MTPDELLTSCDEKGYLADWKCWTPEIAATFAAMESIKLTDAHWEIIHLLREYYDAFEDSPANRALVKYTKQQLGPDKGTSLYLLSLFPGSPTKSASRIAGLPKPKNCL